MFHIDLDILWLILFDSILCAFHKTFTISNDNKKTNVALCASKQDTASLFVCQEEAQLDQEIILGAGAERDSTKRVVWRGFCFADSVFLWTCSRQCVLFFWTKCPNNKISFFNFAMVESEMILKSKHLGTNSLTNNSLWDNIFLSPPEQTRCFFRFMKSLCLLEPWTV